MQFLLSFQGDAMIIFTHKYRLYALCIFIINGYQVYIYIFLWLFPVTYLMAYSYYLSNGGSLFPLRSEKEVKYVCLS